jgi:hypothetical protein
MQDCDITLKALLTVSANTLLRLIGVSGLVLRSIGLELPEVRNRQVDFLVELTSTRLLHIELQSTNDPCMPLRMLEYGTAVWRKTGIFPLQVVLFVGNGKLSMPDSFQTEGLEFRYRLVDIRNLDGEVLLASELISDNILAVLTRTEDAVSTVRRIMSNLARVAPGEREDALRKLLILSGIRGLAQIVEQQRRSMPVTFDIMDNEVLGPVLREGIAQGIEIGIAQGIEKGISQGVKKGLSQGVKKGLAQGVEIGSRQVVRSLLEKRFGPLPAWADQRLAAFSASQTDDLALRFLDAETLDELFR